MKGILFFMFALYASYAVAQNKPYPVQLKSGLTVLFPAKPIVTDDGFTESYVAETPRGTFTVMVRNHNNDSLSSSVSIDTLIEGSINNLMSDPNLGDISDTERITKGELSGMYYKMEWNEPAIIVMSMILVDKKFSNHVTVYYQYVDTGGKVDYDKESFLASVQE